LNSLIFFINCSALFFELFWTFFYLLYWYRLFIKLYRFLCNILVFNVCNLILRISVFYYNFLYFEFVIINRLSTKSSASNTLMSMFTLWFTILSNTNVCWFLYCYFICVKVLLLNPKRELNYYLTRLILNNTLLSCL